MDFDLAIQRVVDSIEKENGTLPNDSSKEVVFESFRVLLRKDPASHLGRVTDLAIQAAHDDVILPEQVFELFMEAIEISTVKECEDIVWGELEKRLSSLQQSTLTSSSSPPKLALLKVANELLRKVSPIQEPQLCGRILSVLANSIPLSDPSGFNNIGTFNKEHETVTESEQEYLNKTENTTERDFLLYYRFWRLQRYVSAPIDVEIIQHDKFVQELRICVETTLAEYNRWHCPRVEVEDEDDLTVKFATTYLTAGRLFYLQLRDPKLRRQILTQLMFFLKQLENASNAAQKAEEVPSPATALASWLPSWQQRTMALLEQIEPNGKEFCQSLSFLVAQDAIWETWKTNRRLNAKKPPTSSEAGDEETNETNETSETNEKETMAKSSDEIAKKLPIFTKITDEGWRQVLLQRSKEGDTALHGRRHGFEKYFGKFVEANDPDEGIDEEYHPRNSPLTCFLGLRGARECELRGFETGQPGNFEDIVNWVVSGRRQDDVHPGEEAHPKDSPSSQDRTNESAKTEETVTQVQVEDDSTNGTKRIRLGEDDTTV